MRSIASSSSPPSPLRRNRALVLGLLLAGMVLSVVMAPSALQAQQQPPQGDAGYAGGAAGMPNGLALAAHTGSSGSSWPWVIAVVVVVLALLGAALVYLIRNRAEA